MKRGFALPWIALSFVSALAQGCQPGPDTEEKAQLVNMQMGLASVPKKMLIVGGGIAAYKSLELVRLIAKAGGQTRVILTESGAEFVTPLSLAALSGHPVRSGLFHPEEETTMGHIELSRWADLVVVAPATAGPIAKAANGLADDLASTTLIATDKRVLLAPASATWVADTIQSGDAAAAGSGSIATWRTRPHRTGSTRPCSRSTSTRRSATPDARAPTCSSPCTAAHGAPATSARSASAPRSRCGRAGCWSA